ncbi:hypothetical protein [Sphingomonas radiodurans]|uniref:hypothetical protein n=1 Tax=Sphingomonas radiodurans TaxID=2890321 RepID=UPI001E4EF2B1|nr:hypothetical protein [Sphingomonas radiodurans]WBH15363.1 hypothetical protein LLW23_10960 [Sphingomonas radiodurans]
MADPSAAASLIGALVTAAGFIFAGSQIYISRKHHDEERRWKRSEFVRTLLSEMVNNPNIALVSRILDWREGPARIPEPFQPLFAAMRTSRTAPAWDRHRTADDYFEIDWGRFIRALKVYRDPDWRDPDMYMYRTCFDSFCAFIQGVAEDVRTIGVASAEYADLSFYCHRIIFPLNAARRLDDDADAMLERYIKAYYNEKTYDVIVSQAQVYADTHEGEFSPADKVRARSEDAVAA